MGKLVVGLGRLLPLCALLLVLPCLMRPDVVFAQQLKAALNPTQGPPGATVTGAGTIGYNPAGVFIGQPGDHIQIMWDDTGGTILAETIVRSDGTFSASFNVPSNATAGSHPIYFLDRREGYLYVIGASTFTVGQGTGTSVILERALTHNGTGDFGEEQTIFNPGETIRYAAIVNNSTSSAGTPRFDFHATGPREIFSWTGDVPIPPGEWYFHLHTSVPTDAPLGTYTHQVTMTYNGQITTLQSSFTVQSQPTPGWYKNSGPSKISEDSTWRVSWENSYIYQHPGTDNLYWYAQIEFRNVSSQIQNFQCNGVGCPSCIKEHITRGGTYLGFVTAEDTFCMHNPNFTAPVNPGEAFYDWVIFHNVPWRDDAVSLEWGSYGSSALVNPWYSPYPPESVPPAVCPPELVSLGTCQPWGKVDNQYWAGYAAYGAIGGPIKFAKVEASWIVQSIECPLGTTSRAAYWVGLGGYNAPLEQIGTASFCVYGVPWYTGLWQIINGIAGGAQYIDAFTYPVYPNDHMEASVTDFGQGIYLLTLHNLTRGWTWSEFHTGSTNPEAVQTAECIVEWPPGDTPAPFSNFGAFTFVGCKADNRSLLTYPRILQFNIKPGNTVRDELSVIDSHSDFTVTWKPE